MKKSVIYSLLIAMFFAVSNCFAAAITNDGMTLTVPDEYIDLLVIDTPANDENGMLFTIFEKESIEVAKRIGYTTDGAGWLFNIGRVSEEKGHEMLCQDNSGADFFARDNQGNYYVYYHPTDVRMIREDYTAPEVAETWTMLNEWANSMKDTFVTDNSGLTAEKHGSTVLDIYLSRLMYKDNENYTVSTTEYGPMQPNGIIAADYIEPLTKNVMYKSVYDKESPDGEYVVLNFPDDDIRFDFFFMTGKENYIRQVWNEGKNEMLYKAEFADETIKATNIMHGLYQAMVLANSLGYTADDMVGTWAEKIAGRGSIEISRGEIEGQYNVWIHWSSSAFEMNYWEMTAYPTNRFAELRYDDCKSSVITFTSETESAETVVYENGTGTFSLLSTYELMWNDETGHVADNAVFINTGK